ncbi:MAG: DUF444 family protein [Sandaracinaceae bacterium]|nr:DUF444 family protein [Sandaracinaceae bacterium]
MSLKIDQDHTRFRKIVRGKIRDNLRQYISKGEMLGKQGKDVVSIPVPHIDIPRFRFGGKQQGGVGQGEGEAGDPIGGEPGEGDGRDKAGSDPGQHAIEVELSLEELADLLGEELSLPNIKPKGKSAIVDQKERYVGIRRVGPNSLRHFKRTFRSALRRQIALGSYDPARPVIIPTRDDMRYRSWKTDDQPVTNAVLIYMMDVSGSMGDEQKEIVRIESFWIDTWLRRQYKGIETRFIIHDAAAREVDRDTFFRTRESGGTMISSAYKLCANMIEHDYPTTEWNIYPFHFSDGDNWSAEDTLTCVDILRNRIIPASNVFCYGQVDSPYGSGQFIKDLRQHFVGHEGVIVSEIANRDRIVESIRDFLGKGK